MLKSLINDFKSEDTIGKASSLGSEVGWNFNFGELLQEDTSPNAGIKRWQTKATEDKCHVNTNNEAQNADSETRAFNNSIQDKKAFLDEEPVHNRNIIRFCFAKANSEWEIKRFGLNEWKSKLT